MSINHTTDLIRELSDEVYKCLFLPCLSLRSVVIKDREHILPKKKSLNSLASWVKELMKNGFKQGVPFLCWVS